MHAVQTHRLFSMEAPDRDGMFRLRYETFHTRLGWDVTVEDGMERDHFDTRSTVYIIGKASDQSIDACWRLLPTTGPYMLRDTFPELLHGQAAPQAVDCWELSRFAVAADRVQSGTEGFGELTVALMAESARFALQHGIHRYVTVTTTPIERLMKRQGLHIHRIGPPIRIGMVMTVACVIEVDDITLRAVGVSASGVNAPPPRDQHEVRWQ
ncbi:MAG: acyl-homoserine-lactone synthase [Rhodoferax sp.]